jgi:hypothetical protein
MIVSMPSLANGLHSNAVSLSIPMAPSGAKLLAAWASQWISALCFLPGFPSLDAWSPFLPSELHFHSEPIAALLSATMVIMTSTVFPGSFDAKLAVIYNTLISKLSVPNAVSTSTRRLIAVCSFCVATCRIRRLVCNGRSSAKRAAYMTRALDPQVTAVLCRPRECTADSHLAAVFDLLVFQLRAVTQTSASFVVYVGLGAREPTVGHCAPKTRSLASPRLLA